MNDKKEGILFTIDCLNSHKYNFDYNLEELIKEAKQLQSNWNSLREWVQKHYDEYKDMEQDAMFEFGLMLDKMNELEGKDNNGK